MLQPQLKPMQIRARKKIYPIVRIKWLKTTTALFEKAVSFTCIEELLLSHANWTWPTPLKTVEKKQPFSYKLYDLFPLTSPSLAWPLHEVGHISALVSVCSSAGARSAAPRLSLDGGSSSRLPVVSYPDAWPLQIKQHGFLLWPPNYRPTPHFFSGQAFRPSPRRSSAGS